LLVLDPTDTGLADAMNTNRRAGSAPPLPAPEATDRSALQHILPPGAVHQGFAALAEPLPEVALEDLLAAANTPEEILLLVLDQATDPRNLGGVLRVAAAFGAAAVIVQSRHSPPASGFVAKAASGALEVVPIVRVVNIARALRTLRDADCRTVGLDADAPTPLATALRPASGGGVTPCGLVLVLGSEGRGLRRLVAEACDTLACIPIAAHIDSLNVAASAAIALYESVRHRTTDGHTPPTAPPNDDTAARFRK
jgi:23S rRNA (guanosine2251-2'-O)-methyltransferase